jgi:lipopolysaccharide/colanic/teichoic acid biosynthesis glycosyltransferase
MKEIRETKGNADFIGRILDIIFAMFIIAVIVIAVMMILADIGMIKLPFLSVFYLQW